ncbi:MAG: hypothetical protein IPF99_36735 [Deltaproteobacteria bacterium]|nr:hypothetical protein [Deltaproteobacteria bacterium]
MIEEPPSTDAIHTATPCTGAGRASSDPVGPVSQRAFSFADPARARTHRAA